MPEKYLINVQFLVGKETDERAPVFEAGPFVHQADSYTEAVKKTVEQMHKHMDFDNVQVPKEEQENPN